VHVEGRALELNLGVEGGEVGGGQQGLAREAERCLDEASHAGGRVRVADGAFNRADCAVALGIRPRRGVGIGQGPQLDPVAHQRAGRVALDIAHLPRVSLRHAESRAHGGGLPRDARRGVPRLARAVVAHAVAAYDREHVVVVRDRLGQSLEHHRADGVAEDSACRRGIEGAHLAVGRHYKPLFEEIAHAREGQRGAARQCHVRLLRLQRGRRLGDGRER
jgi:hypothetical protein